MNTTWSVISGGRLKRDQLTKNPAFRITSNDEFESILLKTPTIKQSFEEGLRRKLAPGGTHFPGQAALCMEYRSAVVPRELDRRNVELWVTVKDSENDGMLWYFILVSPEEHIAPDNLDEIVSLVADRLLQRCAQGLSVNDNTPLGRSAY